jgi:UDP-N-acetylglucosamine--N-acetylmuramyl-(pentapeptide) pyrophosphoryl-undecaprenol N-acetylglucosamine transferase
MQNYKKGQIIVTGGGSGGHTMTSVAVIGSLLDKHPALRDRVVFIGGSTSMEGEERTDSLEERVLKNINIKFVKIRSGKFRRSFSFSTIKMLLGVVGGLIDSLRYFKRNKVSVVFSTGGYVSVPVCIAAWIRKVPVVIHEQTTRVGLSNKISARFADEILVGFDQARKYFPKRKTIFVGNPVRKCITDARCWPKDIVQKLRFFEKRSKKYPVVLISGGGQGSHLLNEVVRQSLNQLLLDYQIILLTGDNKVNQDYKCVTNDIKKLSSELQKRIIVKKFAGDEIGAFLNTADVYVGRSGAMSVYEVGVLSIPSIFIPIPWVTHNEQYHNAKVLKDLGVATIINQGEISPEVFVLRLKRFVKDLEDGKHDFDRKTVKSKFVTNADTKIVSELAKYFVE